MASKAVLTYMKNSNRPYSANDILMNIKGDSLSKISVQKALDELVVKGKIKEKVYGKQKVYCIIQEEDCDNESDDLKDIDDKLKKKIENSAELEKQLTSLRAELKKWDKPKLDELIALNKKLEEENKELKIKLEQLSSEDTITEEECQKVEKLHENLKKEYKKRKRICMDVLDAILEGYPKSKKQLYEEIGIDVDNEEQLKKIL